MIFAIRLYLALSFLGMGAIADTYCPSRPMVRLREGRCLASWQEPFKKETYCLTAAQWSALLEVPQSRCVLGVLKKKSILSLKNDATEKEIRYRYSFVSIAADADSQFGGWDRIRQKIETLRFELWRRWSPVDPSGILRSIFLGSSSEGSPWVRPLGFVHVQVMSGMHLYALETLAITFSLRWAKAIIYPFWIFIWLLQGMRWGLLRPLFVVGLKRGFRKVGLEWRPFSPLLIALGIEAIAAWVYADHAWGRWHYALAVGGGLMGYECAKKNRHWAMALASWVWVVPLDIYENGFISVLTSILSLLSIPFVLWTVMPAGLVDIGLFLMGDTQKGGWVSVLEFLSSGFLQVIEGTRHFPVICLIEGPILCLTLLVSAFFLLFFKATDKKWFFFAGILIAFGIRGVISIPTPPAFVEQLDIGQGDAALVQTATGLRGMIDVGPRGALSSLEWLKLLGRSGFEKLDFIALTHLDADHAGALREVVDTVRVGKVCATRRAWRQGADMLDTLRLHQIPTGVIEEGCLPIDSFVGSKVPKNGQNIGMAAFLVDVEGERTYLNYGDASSEEEVQLMHWDALQDRRGQKKIILKISHHGSRFSSEAVFLKWIQPSEAWISSGVNTYGHPAREVLANLKKQGIPIRQTVREGRLSTKN